MAETEKLLSRPARNGAPAAYGSVPYERLSTGVTGGPIRFVYRRKDCVVVSIMTLLVVSVIATTLLLGVPRIRSKAEKHGDEGSIVVDGRLLKLAAGSGGLMASAPVRKQRASDEGTYATAAVSSNIPGCSTIAVDVLRANGSVVDAAIAATFCLSVCDLHHSGLGGGFVMTLYDRKRRRAEVLDARETAPALANRTMFQSTPSSAVLGGMSVAVPGLVRGLWDAHGRHGKLPWSALVEPSIALARDGTAVGKSLAEALDKKRADILQEPSLDWLVDPRTADVWKEGDQLRMPALARTLQILASQGGDAFYNGSVAHYLADDIWKLGGIVTVDDLREYRVRRREAVTVEYPRRGATLHSAPLPASGHLIAFFLNILDDDGRLTSSNASELRTLQLMAEAFKFTYAARALLGDSDYVNVTETLTNLTSKEYAAHVRKRLREDATFPPEYYGSKAFRRDAGTSHVSIVAPNGDAVALTSTINLRFGALVASESTGIVLNNEMDDFSSPNLTSAFEVPPSEPNFIEPGKRPLSSMCPTVVTDARTGDVLLVTGGTGSTRITSATAQVILRHLFLYEDLRAATDDPRLHHQLFPNVLEVEAGVAEALVRGLEDIGHRVVTTDKSPTSVSSIGVVGGRRLHAVADGRVGAGQAGF